MIFYKKWSNRIENNIDPILSDMSIKAPTSDGRNVVQ